VKNDMSKQAFFKLIIFFQLLFGLAIKGQIIPWQATGPAGLNIQALAASGDAIIAGAYGNGVYFSFNDGIYWVKRINGLRNFGIFCLAVKDQQASDEINGWGSFSTTNFGLEGTIKNILLNNLITKPMLVFRKIVFYVKNNRLFFTQNTLNCRRVGSGYSVSSLAHNNLSNYFIG